MNLNKSPPIFKGLRHPCLGIAAGGDLILGNRQQLIHHIDDHDDFLLTELVNEAKHIGMKNVMFFFYFSFIARSHPSKEIVTCPKRAFISETQQSTSKDHFQT